MSWNLCPWKNSLPVYNPGNDLRKNEVQPALWSTSKHSSITRISTISCQNYPDLDFVSGVWCGSLHRRNHNCWWHSPSSKSTIPGRPGQATRRRHALLHSKARKARMRGRNLCSLLWQRAKWYIRHHVISGQGNMQAAECYTRGRRNWLHSHVMLKLEMEEISNIYLFCPCCFITCYVKWTH